MTLGSRFRNPNFFTVRLDSGFISIKALEIAEEKEAVAQYGSTDSGASLGDILGAALSKAKEGDEDEDAPKPKRKGRSKGDASEAASDE